MPKCRCALCKSWSRCISWCNCREPIHTFSARARLFMHWGLIWRLMGGPFLIPQWAIASCPHHSTTSCPSHSAAASSVNMHAGFLISNPPLLSDTPILPGPPPQKPCSTGQTLCAWTTWDIGGMSGPPEKKLILRLKMFSQFKTEDWKLLCNRQLESQQFLVSISTEFLAYKFRNENPITLSENQLKLRL